MTPIVELSFADRDHDAADPEDSFHIRRNAVETVAPLGKVDGVRRIFGVNPG